MCGSIIPHTVLLHPAIGAGGRLGYETGPARGLVRMEQAMRQTLAIFSLCAALAACGRNAGETASPADTAPPPASAEVAAIDEFGPLDIAISDLAFWTHPRLTFQGLLIAATPDGLVAFNIEDGAEVARAEGIAAGGVDVVYAGAGADARAIAIAADENADALRFFEIDNDSRAFNELAAAGRVQSGAFCAGPDRDGVLRIISLNGRRVTLTALTREPQGVNLAGGDTVEAPTEIIACAADALDGSVFLLAKTGAVYSLAADDRVTRFAAPAIADPTTISLALFGLVEGGPTDECCGVIAVLSAADAGVHFLDRDDGSSIGRVSLSASFDVEGVPAATALGLGYGNFGAVYRDGVLALATDGETPAIRLTPLNGVMSALAKPIGPVAEPRALAPQPEADDGFVIDVELVTE